jgi:hypothetical protein
MPLVYTRNMMQTPKIEVKTNCMALVRERTIPTEKPLLIDEVSTNFCGLEGVAWWAQRIPTAIFSAF